MEIIRALVLALLAGACSSSPPPAGDVPDAAVTHGDAPGTVDADPGPHHAEVAYAANYANGISGFSIAADGTLAPLTGSPFAADRFFFGIAPHPTLPVVYAADYRDHAVRAYHMDPDTHALAALGDPVALGRAAVSIAVDPRGRFVYVGDLDDVGLVANTLRAIAISPTDGALAAAPASSLARDERVDAIAAAPSGNIVYTTGFAGIRTYTVDDDGTLTELRTSPLTTAEPTGGFPVFHPTHPIVYTARGALAAFTAEPSSGALAPLTGSPFGTGSQVDPGAIGLALDPRGRFACVLDNAAGTVTVYALHADGTVATPGTAVETGSAPFSVAVDLDGRFVYIATDFGDIAAFSVDPTTFALTPLHRYSGAVGNAPELVVVQTN